MSILAASGLSVTGDGSFPIQQVDISSSTTQGQIEIRPNVGIPLNVGNPLPHPTANATATASTIEGTIQETQQFFGDNMLTHPTLIPDWLQPFHEWLPARRQRVMSVPGLGDPVLCRPFWVQVFGYWLQLRHLLPSQGLGNLAAPQSCWYDLFDLWLQQLLEPDSQGLDTSHAFAHAPLSSDSSTSPPTTSYTSDMSSSNTTLPTRKARKRIPNAVSKLTVQDVQEGCRKNGAEESVIARIAIVFTDVVSREHLKLAGQPGAGSSAGDHKGYMEFADRAMVNLKNVTGMVPRYSCKLCGRHKRPRWKNSKDLLVHVWDTHCDPQDDGKPFPSFGSVPGTDNHYSVE
jgi:hypothetical protein